MSANGLVSRAARFASVVALVATAVAPVFAEELGQAARREQERRKRLGKTSSMVYTEESLAAVRARGDGREATTATLASSPNGTPAATTPSAAPEASTLRLDPIKDPAVERVWRARFAAAREAVRHAEERAWVTRVEVVFVAGIPVQQQVRRFEETAELRRARQELVDLEEELRRAGLPPGWGRE